MSDIRELTWSDVDTDAVFTDMVLRLAVGMERR